MAQGVQARRYQNSRLPGAAGGGTGRRWSALAAAAAVGMALWMGPATATAGQDAIADGPAPGIGPDDAVVAAREAMQRKQWDQLASLAEQARGSALQMYPEYWLLRQQINDPFTPIPAAAIQAFMERYRGAYLADKLRGDWILAAARAGDFATVRRLGGVTASNAQIDCAVMHAHHLGGQRAEAAKALAVFEPGRWCWALFDQLVADRVLGWDELSVRLRDAIEQDKTTEARRFAAYLLSPTELKSYDAMMRDPMKWLVRQDKPRTRVERELVTLALGRLARKDLDVGDSYVRRNGSKSLPRENLAWVRSQFALIAALRLDGRAHQWYSEAGHVRLSEYNHAWRVRAALLESPIDWQWVRASIAAMPPAQRADSAWVYWEARALAATGHAQEAARRYETIAGEHGFYGQLASEELGRPITIPPRPAPLTEQELAQARAHPGLQRALKLFALQWRSEAVPEWNFSLRGMNDRQLLAAAELAREHDIYDRVVNTSERTVAEVDFSQRYIAPFEGKVTEQARRIALDPAWVYGLIRQESRFVMNARSHVGASGLMQLMPATARWTARKIGMEDFHPARVNEFETNTTLGTHYLNIVLQDVGGSQLLASAGYNAGPRRPQQWTARLAHPVEGAIFAETIPITETRQYVKNVMANATYYAAMFTGQPQSLKQRLGKVVPRMATASRGP